VTHDLARVTEPPVFGYRAWLCRCGQRFGSADAHVAHARSSAPHAVAMDGNADHWRCMYCDWEGPYTEAVNHINPTETQE